MHFKMQYHCLDFSILFVWSGVYYDLTIYFKLCKKRLWAEYFFIIVFFLLFFSLSVLFFALSLVCSPYRGLGLAHIFLILRHQVVSIMCEKCLLYSFKKFQAEYKTLYINLSIYLF